MNLGIELALAAGCYLLGGISPGYWLVRWKTGRDVREQGSGSSGATNSGLLLGRGGFALTLVLDALKGATAVLAARMLGATTEWTALAALAVVVGHIWPAQLQFRGGRGVAPLIGAWLVLAPLALAPCLVLGALVLFASRAFVRSGLAGLLLLPLAVWWQLHSAVPVALSTLTVAVVLFAHRRHLLPPRTAALQPPGGHR
ncbi:MAG: glycerol-3-phosphate acyltransferase [Planctomycetes bacterium]|nr:glycerol-3-phosphate acyltransferase [Planctomycetota bacterium]